MTVDLSRRALLGLARPRPLYVEARGCLARTGCCVCVERCVRPGAIRLEGVRVEIDADHCDRCGACQEVCPAPTPCIVLG